VNTFQIASLVVAGVTILLVAIPVLAYVVATLRGGSPATVEDALAKLPWSVPPRPATAPDEPVETIGAVEAFASVRRIKQVLVNDCGGKPDEVDVYFEPIVQLLSREVGGRR